MSATDAERLAVLESENRAMMRDIYEIKESVKSLEKIAAQGGGAFNAILLVGGLIGWIVGIGGAIYALFKH